MIMIWSQGLFQTFLFLFNVWRNFAAAEQLDSHVQTEKEVKPDSAFQEEQWVWSHWGTDGIQRGRGSSNLHHLNYIQAGYISNNQETFSDPCKVKNYEILTL